MYTFIVILILIVCLFLACVVLVQNSKGGGLAANFGGANQVMGVRRTTETIEKITWGLAIALVVLSLFATMAIPRHYAEANLNTEVDVNAAKSLAPAASVPTAAEAAAEAPAQAE
ncbi:MAG: preprotein translocase subunit SecG [Bacteroidales bacterium]|nr:preprotein translocase subunit SecG [Bacteroidales bacterium]